MEDIDIVPDNVKFNGGPNDRVQSIPDILKTDQGFDRRYCNILVIDETGSPVMYNNGFVTENRFDLCLMSGMFTAINFSFRNTMEKNISSVIFQDGSCAYFSDIRSGKKDYRLLVVPTRRAEWLLHNFTKETIRQCLDSAREIDLTKLSGDEVEEYGITPKEDTELQVCVKIFYHMLNKKIHKETVGTQISTESFISKEDIGLISPSGHIQYLDPDNRGLIDRYRTLVSSIADSGVQGEMIIKLNNEPKELIVKYTNPLTRTYRIQLRNNTGGPTP